MSTPTNDDNPDGNSKLTSSVEPTDGHLVVDGPEVVGGTVDGEPVDGGTVDGGTVDGGRDEGPEVLTADSELLVEPIESVETPGDDETGTVGVDDVVASSPLQATSRQAVAISDPNRRLAERCGRCEHPDRVEPRSSLSLSLSRWSSMFI